VPSPCHRRPSTATTHSQRRRFFFSSSDLSVHTLSRSLSFTRSRSLFTSASQSSAVHWRSSEAGQAVGVRSDDPLSLGSTPFNLPQICRLPSHCERSHSLSLFVPPSAAVLLSPALPLRRISASLSQPFTPAPFRSLCRRLSRNEERQETERRTRRTNNSFFISFFFISFSLFFSFFVFFSSFYFHSFFISFSFLSFFF
jgi:hypothetical protein